VNTARQTLIAALNKGTALGSYIGHSAPDNWTDDPLFTSEDAKALSNYGKPAAVVQFGCWNVYFVDPEYNSLGHLFLLSGTNGASVLSGATTLTGAQGEYEMGRRLIPLMGQPGKTTGDAIKEAKESLAQDFPGMLDMLVGYALLGDPTAVVQK
jgi:Peptidase family C25